MRIPFHNILWVELLEDEMAISYAAPRGKNVLRPRSATYSIDKSQAADAAEWVEKLLDCAYGRSQRRKRIKVLVNPAGGQGKAQRYFGRDIDPILRAAHCQVDVEKTAHRGHAIELAQNLDVDAYDAVACCSGDGLPHEVFNGLAKRKDAARALRKIAVVQLPCGSGNAMCWNLCGTGSPSLAAVSVVKGVRTALDLVSITQGDRRTISFLSQAFGIVAEVDVGTDHLRWMGEARFLYGFLTRLLRKPVYPCHLAVGVAVGDKAGVREHCRRETGRDTSPLSDREDVDDQREGRAMSEDEAQGLPPLKYGTAADELPEGSPPTPHKNLGNFYAGNMAYMSSDGNFFPAALPADGCLDMLNIAGDIDRRVALKLMFAVQNNTFFDLEPVSYRKVLWYRIIPGHATTNGGDNGGDSGSGSAGPPAAQKRPGYVSIDGETYPLEPFQAEVHRGLGTVLSKTGRVFESPRFV